MLIQLDIENIAVIEKASIEFEHGLNVITGETGAGKSLLINSLNMVLGARASRELIREGANFAKVSAVFFCDFLNDILSLNGIDTDGSNIIITRKLYKDGRNLCHINGCAVSVAQLRTIGEKLVVIHGQRDSSELMDTSSHINFLDAFCENEKLLNEYKEIYKELCTVRSELEKLNGDKISRQSEIEYLSYQVQEIENANLSENEEDELLSRKSILENAENIEKNAQKAYSALYFEGGAKESLYSAMRALEALSMTDSSAQGYCEKITDLYYETEELSRDISSYISSIEFKPEELSQINDRLDIIRNLKRKFGGEISDILKFYNEASEKLLKLKSFDDDKEALAKRNDELTVCANKIAEQISQARKKSAVLLSERLTKELESLDMPKCKIEFLFTPCALSANGIENVEFVISTNPSESPKSLAKIASGGEISRVMLAIKSVFSDFDKIPTLLFDEIDTGVSGRAAEKIANKMQMLSEKYQLICVTHLPVIAAAAKHHMLLEKKTDSESFKTIIRSLSEKERISEIARIISGDNINDISLKNAASMLGI
ncbi:MAG: DNA repair protein RecN [Clostridia bacterium]|nr:DNA repair protein RecN [Clostridia bacterium]